MSHDAINIAHKYLKLAAEAEKTKDRKQANDWRAKSAEYFRVAADPHRRITVRANIIQLSK